MKEADKWQVNVTCNLWVCMMCVWGCGMCVCAHMCKYHIPRGGQPQVLVFSSNLTCS